LDKRLDGIADVRDESDRTGLRIVIELKKEVDARGILQFLFKNTDLQIAYNFNMIAIHNRRPTMMTLPLLLDAYIAHQKDVVTRRSNFELQKAKDRIHIVEGLMKALSILDEVIITIRQSQDKRDAKNNLIRAFSFTEEQAEAIVSLQLYRLTNTDITDLRNEEASLQKLISELLAILNNESQLAKVIKQELQTIRKQFAEPRRSIIEDEIEEIKITLDVMIPSEEVVVTVTKDGYVKRTSTRSYSASNGKDFAMKESDYLLFESMMNTQHHLLLFTSLGNYIYQPIHELPEIRWKDLGQHVSSIVSLDSNETIIKAIPIDKFDDTRFILAVSKLGQIKRSSLAEYQVQRYSRALNTMNLKKGDQVVYIDLVTQADDVFIATLNAYAVRFNMDEVPVTGVKTGGVKGINLKDNDVVVNATTIPADARGELFLVTHRGAAKKMSLKEFEQGTRGKRGIVVLRELKSNAHRVSGVIYVQENEQVVIETAKGVREVVETKPIRNSDRYSNGSFIVDTDKDGDVVRLWKVLKKSIESKKS
jgi:topoisomerase-4 subunit A